MAVENQQAHISVFIPAYNAAERLSRTLESLRCQTVSPMEVIIVDDCSTDQTGRVAEDFIQQHTLSHWRVIHHSKNQGLSCARNTALAEVRGEYVFSLDADDILKEDILEKLYEMIVSTHADLAVCGYSEVDVALNPVSNQCKRKKLERTVFSFPQDVKKMVKHHYALVTFWGKLYRRSAIEGLRNEPGMTPSEDALFLNEFLLRRHPCVVMDTSYSGYLYIQYPNTLSRRNSLEKNNYWRSFLLRKITAFASKENSPWIFKEYSGYLRWVRKHDTPRENLIQNEQSRELLEKVLLPVVKKFGSWRQGLFLKLLLKRKRWPFRLMSLFGW